MSDDPRLQPLARFTPENELRPGYGESYLFLVGRDDVHGILHYLLSHETHELAFNQYGYDDETLANDILNLMRDPGIVVEGTLDLSQSKGKHEAAILSAEEAADPAGWANSIAIGNSATHQISHTKGAVLSGQGIAFEGSTNWSNSGEGAGIILGGNQVRGYKAQNNTLLVTTNPVAISRFRTQLSVEHKIALQQQAKRAA